jgi:hypothetical protein
MWLGIIENLSYFSDKICSGLKDNGLYSLNIWSSNGRTVWEGLRDVAFLKEMCNWR